ncbi:MAG TPA: hypothetical protein VN154_02110, partial [Rhizomicrobium sp.]|nr:hypothetical protein [Rhizomicrobium sp.]
MRALMLVSASVFALTMTSAAMAQTVPNTVTANQDSLKPVASDNTAGNNGSGNGNTAGNNGTANG